MIFNARRRRGQERKELKGRGLSEECGRDGRISGLNFHVFVSLPPPAAAAAVRSCAPSLHTRLLLVATRPELTQKASWLTKEAR